MLKVALNALTFAGIFAVSMTASASGPRYRIEITNLTQGQIMSPPTAVAHSRHVDVFELGQPASAEVAAIAEDANAQPLINALQYNPKVRQIVSGQGPIMPGATAVIEVQAGRRNVLSLLSMLVTTNDAFMGLDSVSLPRRGSATYIASAYDAGSEYNNELCNYIPGPPCGNGGVRDTANAEGYIYVHPGIHGEGDLSVREHDWRNPVARIVITRL